ncbi:prolactin-like [Oncorhynchus kisutch]|uniref:prolactin-like n=1 Tax=Oncorhynchus kisutch TaxID=8019 RepID=UPI0012DC83B1|nr:prolactin-like [Oncorhynchus kisutch]
MSDADMQHLGMISNSLSGLSSPEALDPSSDTSGESQAMSDHDLLYCFRRDSNKVQNYLKILKCRIREELTEVILKLLVAWKDPLWQFHQNMVHQDDFNNFSSNKALEMSYMVHELRKGVEKVADKMQHLGMISNSLSGLSSPEALDPSSDTSGESQAMSDHDLLYCFRRDSNKVQNYLKILKCRIVPENGC